MDWELGDKPPVREARSLYVSGTVQREVLYWYNQTGTRYLTGDEVAQNERQQREKLAAKLRELGIDPDNI